MAVANVGAGVPVVVGTSSSSLSRDNDLNASKNAVFKNDSSIRSISRLSEVQTVRPVESLSRVELSKKTNGKELSENEEQQIRELSQRDREVRAHEQAHTIVGGPYASPPSYEFTVGPDGKRYATSGEVQIDTSPIVDNPAATIRKLDIVIRAALAPADPSPQDQQIARQAQSGRARAQVELRAQLQEKAAGAEPSQEALAKGNSTFSPVEIVEVQTAYKKENTVFSVSEKII